MTRPFEELFKPINIGKIRLKNRISMAPMFTKYASESGEVTNKLIQYLVTRAKGGVGLIILENTCIEWEYGRGDGNPVTLHHDRFRPRLHELVKAVHQHGAKIMPEIYHAGRQIFRSNIEGKQPLAPSAIQSKVGGDMPRSMTEEEIEKTIQDYGDAARRAKECGFDGVEIHGAHGYLISSFISPSTNIRMDRWGGNFENRCRFAVEIVRCIRKEVGPDFPILFRLSAEESTPGGLTLEDGIKYAKVLEYESVDCLDVSHGSYESIKHFPMQGDPLDQLVYLAAAIKAEVSIPVIAVGSLSWDPNVALNVIKFGKADMVHFGRGLLADPDLPKKIRNNQLNDIRRCIRCNECTGSLDKGHFLTCVVNPECGYEYLKVVKTASKYKRIVVVGAGLTGLEYAITAAECGHKVILLEKDYRIGGLALVCSLSACKNPEISNMLRYYEVMIKKYGVDLKLGVEGTVDNILEFSPDLVILAIGSKPLQLFVPGYERIKFAIDKLIDGAEGLGHNICIIGGSGVGIDVAMFMSDKGKKVIVLEMGDLVGRELNNMMRRHLTSMLIRKNVQILTSHKVVKITDNSVIAFAKNEEIEIPCDNVLSAVGFERIDSFEIVDALEKQGIEVRSLGKSQGAGNFLDAIHAGFWSALDV